MSKTGLSGLKKITDLLKIVLDLLKSLYIIPSNHKKGEIMKNSFKSFFIGFIALWTSHGFSAINEADLSAFAGRYELIEDDNKSDCAQTITVTLEEGAVIARNIGEQWGPRDIIFSDIQIKKGPGQAIVTTESHNAFASVAVGSRTEIRTVLSGNKGCLELKESFKYQDPYASCKESTAFTLNVNSGALSYQHRDCKTDRLPLGSETLWRLFVKKHHYPYEPHNFDNNCLYGKAGRENTDAKLKKCALFNHPEFHEQGR